MKFSTAILQTLPQIYQQFDTPVDRIAQDPDLLTEITARLNGIVASHLTPNETLDALLYARKRGLLPRIRRQPHAHTDKPS